MGEAFQALLDDVCAANRAAVGGRAMDYAPVEQDVGRLARAVERGAHQAMLQALDMDAAKVVIVTTPGGDGERRLSQCGDYLLGRNAPNAVLVQQPLHSARLHPLGCGWRWHEPEQRPYPGLVRRRRKLEHLRKVPVQLLAQSVRESVHLLAKILIGAPDLA